MYLVCLHYLVPLSILEAPVSVHKSHDLHFVIVLGHSMHVGSEAVEIAATKQTEKNLISVGKKEIVEDTSISWGLETDF